MERTLIEALTEELKDFAHDHDLEALSATIRTGRDTWTSIGVRHASALSDSRDGWDVEVKEHDL